MNIPESLFCLSDMAVSPESQSGRIYAMLEKLHFQNGIECLKNLFSIDMVLLTALVIIVLTGMIGGVLAKKFKQPLVLGYIFVGVFVGILYKDLFGESANAALNSLADVGVALLLFSMGLEFSKKDILDIYKIAVWGTLTQTILTLFACAGLAWGISLYLPDMFQNIPSMLLFGVAFVSTSTSVVLKTLDAKKRMGTLSSKVMIGMSIVQDLTVIPYMLIVGKLGTMSGGSFQDTQIPLFGGAIFMVLMMTYGSKLVPKALQQVAKLNSKELFILAVTAVALCSGLITYIIGISFSFGAFLAGIVLSDSAYGKKALSELMPIRDLFTMLFFVSIGMKLDSSFLFRHAALVALCIFFTCFIRTSILSCITWIGGYRNVIPFAMLFGMVPTSEIAFVVAQSGYSDHIFSENIYSLILCTAVCSMLIGPIADNLTSVTYGIFRKYFFKNEPLKNNISIKLPELSNHIIIAGGGAFSRNFAHLLEKIRFSYVIIESDNQEFDKTFKDKYRVILGDPQSDVILHSAGIERAKLFIAAANGFGDNLDAIRAVREISSTVSVITRADSDEEIRDLQKYNVQDFVEPNLEVGMEMMRRVLLVCEDSATETQNALESIRKILYRKLYGKNHSPAMRTKSFLGLLDLFWIQLTEDNPLCRKTIANSKIRTNTGSSIVGILRNDQFQTNPGPDAILLPGDMLAVIGNKEQKEKLEILLAASKTDEKAV